MSHGTALIRPWDPTTEPIDLSSLESLLDGLGGPRWFRLPGRDSSRCRAVTTLLHGNEPSGCVALLNLMREGFTPNVDLVCCVVSVAAASAVPRLSQRQLPAERDQNRCFTGAQDDRPGRVARELLALLRQAKPEAIVDLHNTSGAGPAYGVTTLVNDHQHALTRLFADHLVHTGLRLGTLTEATENDCASITIECGGAADPRSHEVATDGLRRYGSRSDLFESSTRVELHRHPVRVELRPGCTVAYAEAPQGGVDVTLAPDMDRYNFGVVPEGHTLARLGPAGLGALRVMGEEGADRTHEFFRVEQGALLARTAFKPLMVTTDADIAASDCLFYAVKLEEEFEG